MAKLDILTLGDGSTWHPDLPGPRHAHYCDWDGCGVLWVCFDPACHEGPARNCPRCVREAEAVQALQDPEREPMFLGPVRESVPDLGETPPDETPPPKRTRRKAGRATNE